MEVQQLRHSSYQQAREYERNHQAQWISKKLRIFKNVVDYFFFIEYGNNYLKEFIVHLIPPAGKPCGSGTEVL